jgi:effector-binding domain-containing protein
MSGKAFARAKFAAVVCAALFGLLSFDGASRAQQNAPAAPATTPAAPPAASGPAATPPSTPTPPSAATPEAPAAPPVDNGAAPGDSASQTIELVGRPGAYIEGKSTWDEGFAALMAAIASIDKELADANLKPAGRPLGIFLETDDTGFRYRAMVPIDAIPAGKTQLTDAIKFGQTPAGKAMKFEHRGSYEDIDSTYEAITAYLDEKGLEEQNLFYEEYLNDVKSPDDPTLEVDIYVLLK